MIGYDASSSDCYSGAVELRINLAVGSDATSIELVHSRVHDFLKAVKVGYFFPGSLDNPELTENRVNGISINIEIKVVDLAITAFAVLGGLLLDCRYHDVSFQSAHAFLGKNKLDLLGETGLRPAPANNSPFLVEFPIDQSGNYALLVEIEFANPIPLDMRDVLLEELALWEILTLAYPDDPDEPAEVGDAQRHFNDPRTIHHHEWVWENADYSAWNLLVNLCCAWHKKLPVVRLHIE